VVVLNVCGMLMAVEIPDEVLTAPLDGPRPDLSGSDGGGLPAPVVLRWIDGQPFGAWSVSLLAGIDATELPPAELPLYLRLVNQAESFLAACKARGIFQLAGAEGGGTRQGLS